MLEGERIKQREQAVAELEAVDLVGELLARAERRVRSRIRDALLVERDADVGNVRDQPAVEEIISPGLPVVAGECDVDVMPDARLQ